MSSLNKTYTWLWAAWVFAFGVIGGMFLAEGARQGVPLRYGGDWDMDWETTDQRLMDWGHVEIAE